jgi:DNA-binding NtrC family response regulator
MSLSLLVVDGDPVTLQVQVDAFESIGYTVHTATTVSDARRVALERVPDVVLIELPLPVDDVRQLIHELSDDRHLEIIDTGSDADLALTLSTLPPGSASFVRQPIDPRTLRLLIDRGADRTRILYERDHLRAREAQSLGEAHVWLPPAVDKLIDLAARNADVPVLIIGEPGTGKGIVAREIHYRSPRAEHAFVAIDCAAPTRATLEYELFGGAQLTSRDASSAAFRGVSSARRGLLEIATEGSLLLRNITELPPHVQPRLLAAIEDGIFRRIGSSFTLRADARIIATTNAPLRDAVAAGGFRADLSYRLQVLTIEVTPLRHRRDELAKLTDALLPRGAQISDAGRRALESYDWPGNVRELKNSLWRAAVLAGNDGITPAHLAPTAAGFGSSSESPHQSVLARGSDNPSSIASAERRAIIDALHETGGNKVRAARLLGIARSTLLEKVRRHGLT